MQNISKEYLIVFHAITDAEEALRVVCERLIAAQQMAEEIFITDSKEV